MFYVLGYFPPVLPDGGKESTVRWIRGSKQAGHVPIVSDNRRNVPLRGRARLAPRHTQPRRSTSLPVPLPTVDKPTA